VVTTFNAANTTFTYASVNITILDAKQTGTVTRLDFKEENTAANTARFLYSDAMRLILADGNSLVPTNGQEYGGPDPGVKRQNWVEFQTPDNVQVNQLVLRVGTETQAQIDIPLTGNADLNKYAAKTINPNKQTQYAGTTWTLVQATRELSYDTDRRRRIKCLCW